MATISRVMGSEATIVSAATITDTPTLSSDVDLETNGYEGTHITVDVDFPASPSHDLVVEILGSLDGTNYDDTAMFSLTVDKGTDPNQVSFIVKDVMHFKVKLYSTGTDDQTVTVKHQPWRWQSV